MHDPLQVLMRLRRAAVDDARRRLGAAVQEGAAAQTARKAAEAAIATESANAIAAIGDTAVEDFSRWLPRGRAVLYGAEQAEADAALLASTRRAELNLARAAAEATDQLMQQRVAQARLDRDRGDQRALDEMAGRGIKL